MLYIMKTAIYDHGVMWIGDDLAEARAKADYFASNHDDGHHRYIVLDFRPPTKSSVMKDWTEGSIELYTGHDSRGDTL